MIPSRFRHVAVPQRAIVARLFLFRHAASLQAEAGVKSTTTRRLTGPSPPENKHDGDTTGKTQQRSMQSLSPISKYVKNSIHTKTEEHVSPSDTPSDSTLGEFRNEEIICAQRLDPEGILLPTSCWIHVNGILPLSSLESIVDEVSRVLDVEHERGIVDLDAYWNPVEEETVPTLDYHSSDKKKWVEAAHLVLSPFGRPTGWRLKFQNRSIVNAILSYVQENHLYSAWKRLEVSEWTEKQQKYDDQKEYPIVTDSMVRFENAHRSLTEDSLRHMLSRYDLAPVGRTVIRWKGKTNDGKRPPYMFIVNFADPSWARAAIRDFQSKEIKGQTLRLVQYPKQIRDTES